MNYDCIDSKFEVMQGEYNSDNGIPFMKDEALTFMLKYITSVLTHVREP